MAKTHAFRILMYIKHRNNYLLLAGLAAWLACETALAGPLDNWHWRNPTPQGHSLFGVTYANGTFVAAGEYGTILTSRDGANWGIQNSGTTEELRNVTYGNGMFMAAGGGSFTPALLTSPDGVNWTSRKAGSRGLFDVTFGNGKFVAVGPATLLSSSDGITWTQPGTLILISTFYGVAYGNGTFVAVGSSGAVWTSSNGANWASRNSRVSNTLQGVTFANGTFVAAGSSGMILTSRDGITWNQQASGTTLSLNRVTHANNTFVAVGDGGTILTSEDGVRWANQTTGVNSDLLGAVANSGGALVAVGRLGTILTSPDASSWTNRDAGPRNGWSSITEGNGLFVTVGSAGSIASSPDGVKWNSQSSGTTMDLLAVGFGGGMYVAVGRSGAILSSSDGVKWVIRNSGNIWDLYDVTFGNGLFVVVGSSAPILTSRDGVSWTRQTSTDVDVLGNYDLRSVSYGNGAFVAVGEKMVIRQVGQYLYGPILTSSDGVNWTDRKSAKTSLAAVSYGNGRFVALGLGAAFTSANGMEWTSQTSPPRGGWEELIFSSTVFVAAGSRGAISSSPDGITWTSHSSGTGRGLRGIASDQDSFVTVGEFGTILQSGAPVAVDLPPILLTQPQSQTASVGSTVSFNVVASGTAPLSYQWHFNGKEIPGATNASFRLTNVEMPGAGRYQVVVSNTAGSVASSEAVLTISPIGKAPAISSFAPVTGAPGTVVVIRGTNLLETSEIKFGDMRAGFVIVSSTQIVAAVPGGAVTGPITILAPGSTVSSAAQFTVTPSANQMPAIWFDSPSPGQTFVMPTEIFMSATAQDRDSGVKRVEYYVGKTMVYGLETSPFSTVATSFTWKDVIPGTHSLVAAVVDNEGAVSFSEPLTITVEGPLVPRPTLQISRSGSGFALTWPTNAVGFILETTSTLSPVPAWTPVSVSPGITGNQYRVLEGAGGNLKFYRLRRAP